MKIAIMQPYFLPYIGYWQLINAVDIFVVYDNIKYTKRGWINRNRYLLNGKSALFSLNLKNDSDFLNINQRYLSNEYKRSKLIAKLKHTYNDAPMAQVFFPKIEKIINHADDNLFDYIYNSIIAICKILNIETKIITSSTVNINHSLKSEEKVISICKAMKASTYINPIGGIELYSKERFEKNKIDLKFIRPGLIHYKQYENCFIEGLSVLDVMMFNSSCEIIDMLNKYELI